MIVHIALFKWKDDVTKDHADKAMKNVRQLRKLSGILDIVCGENFSKHSKGLTHAVVVLAKDRASLEAYRNHPSHVTVAKEIEKMEEDGIGVDFEA